MLRSTAILQTWWTTATALAAAQVGISPVWLLVLALVPIFGPVLAYLLTMAFNVFVDKFMSPVVEAMGERKVDRIRRSYRDPLPPGDEHDSAG